MQAIKLSSDQKAFVRHPSGQPFIPWGHNYASIDLWERLEKDPARVEREFAEMKAAGTNVARVHPEMPAFFLGPDKIDPQAVAQLRKLLAIAEKSGI